MAYKTHLKRKMETRHIRMISLGGVIGTGLFLSSGYTIHEAGPLGTVIAYLVGALIVFAVMLCLGELSVAMPYTGAFHVYAKKYIGSTDYRNASPIMRETLVNVINEDLSSYAKKIQCPTLLIWGTNDTAAPIEEARQLESLLIDGGLVELPGYTHYAYLEALPQVINILRNFL